MVHFMNLFETEDDEDEQSSIQYQLMDKSVVCGEALDHKERGEDSQINAYFTLSHPKISSHEGGWCVPNSAEERKNISAEAYKGGDVLNLEILN